jgi:hypothetical protein
MVEQEGYAFYVKIIYKWLPEFFSNCSTIGHSVGLLRGMWRKWCSKRLDRSGVNKIQQYICFCSLLILYYISNSILVMIDFSLIL